VGRRREAGEEVALGQVAAKFTEPVNLEHGLDTFGDGAEVQGAGVFEDELNRVAAVTLAGERADEGAIDLDFVERPAAEPGERAESGAEVAEALDAGEGFGSGGEVRNRGGLGDFDLE